MALILTVEEQFAFFVEVKRHLKTVLIGSTGVKLNGVIGRFCVNTYLRSACNTVLTFPDLNHPILALVIELVALRIIEHHGYRSAGIIYLAEAEISLPGILRIIENALLGVEIKADIQESVSVNSVKKPGIRVISDTCTEIFDIRNRIFGQVFYGDIKNFALAYSELIVGNLLFGYLRKLFCVLFRKLPYIVGSFFNILRCNRLRYLLH